MEGSFLSPPAKRSKVSKRHHGNGSSKRSKHTPPPIAIPPGHVSFRLLCNVSRIGGVIGKYGAVIQQLQQATSAKIRVEDAPSDSPDRVVVVVASGAIKTTRLSLTVTSEANGHINGGVEAEVSAAQEALIRVFERILDVAAEADGLGVVPQSMVSIRLLAEASQVGSVIGKGGKVVEKIRIETGCNIKVLPAEKLTCAGPTDKIVEIDGDVLAVKKALIAVSRRLQDCPPVEKTKMIRSRPLEAVLHETLPDLRVDLPQLTVIQPLSNSSMSYASGRYPLSFEVDRVPSFDIKIPQEEVKFRILCSNDRVGGVIGKGGTIVKALQSETGASISIGASVSECDERLITITASENTDSRYSPAQNAVIQVFNRSIEAGIEKGLDSGSNKGSPVITRLVVPSNQIGCLLGKGGTIISEMRKVTGAGIRVIGPDQVPKCASENDQIVQISGEFSNVQDALYHVMGRLRENLFPSKTLNDAGTRAGSLVTEFSPYSRVRDSTSFGGHPSIGTSHGFDRNTSLAQNIDHLGLSHNLDFPISPNLWESQTLAGVNSRGITDVGRGSTSHKGGLELGSGSRTAMVTNTTVEIVVPENVVGSVYGENGSNLARLRQISGARVIMHEPHPGTRERIVIISGTPDETQAAQSLLHAFILTGSS